MDRWAAGSLPLLVGREMDVNGEVGGLFSPSLRHCNST